MVFDLSKKDFIYFLDILPNDFGKNTFLSDLYNLEFKIAETISDLLGNGDNSPLGDNISISLNSPLSP